MSIRVTSDAYLTGLARLVNVSAVTSLLNGRVVKGPKREDGTDYPCVTVFISTQDYDPNTTIQLFDAIINIWVAAKKNGTANLNEIGLIEAQIILLIDKENWTNGTTRCHHQNYRGTQGPFNDPQEGDVHFSSVTLRSWMVDLT